MRAAALVPAAAVAAGRRLRRPSGALALLWPSLAIGALFVVPFGLLLRVSVAHREEGGLWVPGLELTHYRGFLDPLFLDTLAFSAGLAFLVAAVGTALAFPFAYALTRLPRRRQVPWLIFLLATLCLSEVLIAFAWQVLFTKRIGLSNLFVLVGLLDAPRSLAPSFGALFACLVYFVLPYVILLLYPALARLDPALVEAARTLGAPPARTFLTVVLPLTRAPILAATILAFVFTVGTFVAPQVLGLPQHWTIAVLIGKAALTGGNLPFAAAMAVFLMATTLLLTGVTLLLGRERGAGA